MSEVTDPELLAKLNGTAPTENFKEVTDPRLLEQLGPAGAGRPQGFLSASVQGMQRAYYQEEGSLRAVAGLVRRTWDPQGGETMIEDALAYQNRGEQQHPRGIDKVEDIDTPRKALTYLGDTLGEGLTRIGLTLATGGVTKAAATKVAPRVLSKVGQKALSYVPEAAMFGQNVASETGATLTELKEATGETQGAVALGAGVVKGTLDTIFPMALGKAAGLTDEAFLGLTSKLEKLMEGSTKARILRGAATGVAVEGGTEGVQELVDVFARDLTDPEFEFLSSETGSRILNAVVAGSVMGGVAGGTVSGLTGEVAKEEAIPEGELPQDKNSVPVEKPPIEGLAELDQAVSQEAQTVSAISATIRDLNRGVAPGSSDAHTVLGFQRLPQGYDKINVSRLDDMPLAPLEVVHKELSALRSDLKEGEKTLDPLEVETKKKLRGQIKQMSNTIALIRAAATNQDSQGVPSAVITEEEADQLFPDLEAANDKLIQQGFMVKPYNRAGNLQLMKVEGQGRSRPVFNFPNDVMYKDAVQQVMKADFNLEKSGFYVLASRNVNRLNQLRGEVNLQTLADISSVPERAAAYRKAVNEASKLDNFKGKERPKVGMSAAMLEAGHVKFNRLMDLGYTMLQWAQSNPTLTPLQNYKDIVQSEKGNSMRSISRADGILKRFMRLGKAQQEVAYDFMEALGRMTYRNQDEIDAKIVRQPTPAEERELIKGTKYRKNKTPMLRETYQVVTEMRQMVHDEFNAYVKDAQEELQFLTDPKQRLAQMKGLNKMVEDFYKRPRFPFTAVGPYVVTVHDKEGNLITARQTENLTESKRDEVELAAKYPNGLITATMLPANVRAWTALPKMVLRDLAQKGYLKGISKEQRDLLEFLADLGPENRRRFISGMNPRKKSVDLQRAFAMWSQNLANATFARRAGPAMEREIAALELARRSTRGGNTRSLGLMIQALRQHMDAVINPPDDWQKMKSFAFMWHILFNVKSALINTTQVPIVTLPYLSARFGDIKAMAALKNAYLDKRTLFMDGKVTGLSDSMSRLLSKGIEDGKVDQSFATELASLAEGTNMARAMAGSKFDRFTKEVSYYGSYLFAAFEKMNRSVVFRAAAQLALDNPNAKYIQNLVAQQPRTMDRLLKEGFSEQEAAAYLAGIDAIDRTMFEYAKWNRPKFMRGGAPGAIFTFWMFTQGMLHFIAHSPGSMRYLMIMLATAGVMGMPGAEDLDELIQAVSQRFFGKDFDPKFEARKLIKTFVDPMIQKVNPEFETASDLLLHGLSHESFGLSAAADAVGLPWVPNLDVSRSISMGRVLPIGPELLKPGIDYNRALADTTERLSGAAFGPLFAVMEALRADGNDFKRWEKAMPAALRGFMRAGRYQAEGLERDSKMGKIIDFDPHDPAHQMEIIGVALGFSPTRLSKKWDERMALQDAINYWDYRRGVLLKQMDYSVYMKDPEGKADTLKAIKAFNSQLPSHFKTKTITAKTLKNSLRERARRRQEMYSKQDMPAVRYYKLNYE